jgi:predicted PurR-regulated permease PerM
MQLPEPPIVDRTTANLVRALLIVALALAIGGLAWMVGGVFDRVHNTLVVIVLAILFAYLVYPPIKLIARRGVPIALAGVLVYAALAILILGALAWLAPAFVAQAQALAHDYPHVVANAQAQLADPKDSPLLGRLPEEARQTIAVNAGKAGALAGGAAGVVASRALDIFSGTAQVVIDLALILGLTLLVIGDLAEIQLFAIRLVPKTHRPATVAFMNDVDGVVGGFVRGQVLLAVGVGVAGTIVLVAVGVPYGLLLGIVAGIASIVPIVGPIAAVVPVLAIAFLTVGLVKAIVVLALFVVIIIVQQNVLVPVVVAKSVGVTPLVIFLALLFGSEAFGILGALLSLPVAGILRVAAERLFPADPHADALFVRRRAQNDEPRAETQAVVD